MWEDILPCLLAVFIKSGKGREVQRKAIGIRCEDLIAEWKLNGLLSVMRNEQTFCGMGRRTCC